MNEEQLILAVPSKGRLEEETRRVFGESRLPIARPGVIAPAMMNRALPPLF